MTTSALVPGWLLTNTCLPCLADPELFFPTSYSLSNNPAIERAKAICAECPVQAHCREWAVARPYLEGIWAATTPLERRRIRVAMGDAP